MRIQPKLLTSRTLCLMDLVGSPLSIRSSSFKDRNHSKYMLMKSQLHCNALDTALPSIAKSVLVKVESRSLDMMATSENALMQDLDLLGVITAWHGNAWYSVFVVGPSVVANYCMALVCTNHLGGIAEHAVISSQEKRLYE